MKKQSSYSLLLALFSVLTVSLQNCNKPDDPVTPPLTTEEPKPEDKIRTGGVLLDTTLYKALPVFTDPLMGARKIAGKDPFLPASYDLTANMPPVGNQGAQSSCVSWAVAYGLQSFYNKLARNTNFVDASGKRDDATVFSPAFVYNQVNGGRDQGSTFRNALDLIQTQGVATLKDMPYKLEGGYFPNQQDYTQQPTEAQKQAAAPYKIKRWSRASTTVASLKRFLYYDYPVAVMVAIDRNFDRPADKVSTGEFVWKTADGSTERGFHGVVLVGYDDQLQAFKIQNSWGTAWANRGYIWLAYDLVPKVLREAYVAIPGEGRSNLKPVQFTTDDVTAIANGLATYGATITDFGDLPVVRYGFAASDQTQTPTGIAQVSKTLTKAPFSFTLSQPTAGTAITYVRPFAEALDGTVFYGPVKSFQPVPAPPVATPVFLSGYQIYDVVNTSAKAGNTITSAATGSIMQHGHVWSKTNRTPTLAADSKTELGVPKASFPQTFTSLMTGLEANTVYYVRGYATTTDGTTTYSWSSGQSFTTTATNISPDTPPSIETNEPTDVTSTSAQVSMQVLSAGGSNVRLDSYGMLFNTDRVQTDAGVGSSLGFGQSAFGKLSGSLTGLVPNTTYYVRAYATYTLINQTGSGKVALGKVFTIKTGTENLTGTWTKLPGETPFKPASGSFLQTVGSLVYMAEPRTGKFYSYNPTSGDVATLSPYATTNAGSYNDEFNGFTFGTTLFMLYSDPSNTKLALFQAYYPAQQTWLAKAPFPGTARLRGTSMSINGKGYYGLGFTYVGGTASMLNDWWEYDPATNKWTQKAAPKPASRYQAASFVIGDKGYLGMGQTYSSTYLSGAEWWEYNPANDSWTKKTPPPVRAVNGIPQTFGAAGLAFSPGNGKGYFLYDNEYEAVANRSVQVFEYDPASDKWTARSRFTGPFRRPGSSIGFGGQRGLLFGGSNTSASIDYKDIWSFTP